MNITQIPNSQSLSVDEIHDYLNQSEDEPTNRVIHLTDVIEAIGVDAARLVIGTLQSAAAADPLIAVALQALSTVGIEISDPMRQSMIYQLAKVGKWPDEVRDAVKSLGVVSRPRWQVLGYESLPTKDQVQVQVDEDKHTSRMINAVALFSERMTINGDAGAVMTQAWIEAV